MREVTVTQVLGRLQNFGAIDPKVLENKANIGKDVHSAIEASIKGDWFPLDEDRRIAYFDSYKKWRGASNFRYLITETRYYDPSIYLSGQIDAVIQDLSGVNVLLDYKTSAKESFSVDQESIWKMQGHLYYHLLRANKILTRDILFLQLRTKKVDDSYVGIEPKEFWYEYDQATMDRCLEEVHRYWEDFDSGKINN